MGSILMTAGSTLADADQLIDRASVFRRSQEQQNLRLAAEFCRLLIAPVDEYGPGFAEVQGFPERYWRKHLSHAIDFLRQSMATCEPSRPEAKRLAHVAGLIEKALKQNLDEKTAIRCWFGDRIP